MMAVYQLKFNCYCRRKFPHARRLREFSIGGQQFKFNSQPAIMGVVNPPPIPGIAKVFVYLLKPRFSVGKF